MIFTRALFTRLFYLYFWRTGGDIFGKGEKTAPRGHFSTFFPVLAGVMGLSTPILGGLKDAFFGPKTRKNGHVLAHPMRPGNGPRFLARKSIIFGHYQASKPLTSSRSWNNFFLIFSSFFLCGVWARELRHGPDMVRRTPCPALGGGLSGRGPRRAYPP